MDSSKIAVKFFVKDASALDGHAFVPVFHQWIQTHALADHLLIDVADYRHVESGPGTVLVAHEANISTDSGGNRLGLLYARKQPVAGDLAERLRVVFRSALQAVSLLESAPSLAGKIQFRTDDAILRINDRLHAPNTAETFAAIRPTLEAFLTSLYGGPVKLSHRPDAETVFEVRLNAHHSPAVNDLLKRL
jgi:hypothetical protein